MTIPKNHLRACPDHRVIADGGNSCPCCVADVEARPDAVTQESFIQNDLRWQIEPETMTELLPLLQEDASRVDEGPVYVAVAELPKSQLAAGYTEQERWFNVVVVEVGNNSREIIKHNSTARDIIEQIESGEQYIESPEYDFDRLDPDEWESVIARYVRDADSDIEFERPEDNKLRITVDVPTKDIHKEMRKEMSFFADKYDLSIYTRNAGNRFEDSIIEVSIDG